MPSLGIRLGDLFGDFGIMVAGSVVVVLSYVRALLCGVGLWAPLVSRFCCVGSLLACLCVLLLSGLVFVGGAPPADVHGQRHTNRSGLGGHRMWPKGLTI